jgi:F-type H+-transporting ATPase subunit a
MKFLLAIVFFTTFSVVNANSEAPETSEHGSHAEPKKFNPGKMILDHVKDAYDWHICDINGKPVSVNLPVIIYSGDRGLEIFSSAHFEHGHASHNGYKLSEGHIISEDSRKFHDWSITKNVAAMLLGVLLLMWVMFTVARRYKKGNGVPSGIQSFMEPIIIFIRDEVAKPSIGETKYKRYMPFLLTLFFFILFLNLLGLVPFFPGGANVSGNIAVTMVLALATFIVTIFSAKKDYWIHIINTPGVPWWLKFPVPLMPIVEFIGLISKPIVLMIRLFANITAGHIIILGFFGLIFIFGEMSKPLGYGVSLFSMAFTLFMSCLELLVAFLQAYVFTLLSALYFGQALEEHHHEEQH